MSQNEQISQQEYVKKCKKAATEGNVIAQNTLGYLYLNGQCNGQIFLKGI